MKHIAIYQRGYVTEAELNDMTETAMAIPDSESIATYWDHNRSERSEFRSLMGAVKDGHVDTIIAQSICRFAKNSAECLKVIKELHEQNVRVWFSKERFWSTDFAGRIMMAIMADLVGDPNLSVEV